MLTSVFVLGNLTAAGVALEKGSAVVVSGSTPAPRPGLGGHCMESAEFITLIRNGGGGQSIACWGLHCGHGCRGGWSEGVICGIIHVTFLKYPAQKGGGLFIAPPPPP